jgi:dimethylargininase
LTGEGGHRSIAITRRVARSIAHCELSFVPRIAIDVDRARREHDDYCAALVAAG